MNFRIINGSVSFGADTILEEINFEVKGKEKVAIVGRNGCGKSTLLKSIVNNDMLEEGIAENKFSIYKEGIYNIGYLKQTDFEDENITMLEEVLKVYSDIINIENKMKEIVVKMQENKSEELAMQYTKLHDRYELLDGYTYKKEYETVISKFGFSNIDKNKKISEFSGGQKTKIAFIKLLLSKPDLLLLDEPTNHLDIETIEWLESYIKNYPKAVVIVSHDRMFINRIVDKIYEIEYGALTSYTGNYDYFEKQKRVNYEKQLKDFEYQQKEIQRLTALVDRFRYKASKAKMAQAKLKQIERMVKLEQPNRYDLKSFKTNFKIEKQSGENVLHISNLDFGYKEKKIGNVTFNLYRGKKIGIIGPNGTGKSTLLKTIIGKLPKISGEIKIGHNVEIGYFDQALGLLDSNKKVFDDFYEEFPDLTVTKIRNSLASFMFYGEDIFREINMLSGGEKVRLALSKILKKGPNLLILDEPTNHLDIVGKESLESMLMEYEGSILFVSHDRFFVSKVADSLLVFDGRNIKYYDCRYDEYIDKYSNIYNIEENKDNLNKEELKKDKIYNNPLKEKGKIERRIKKLEEDISKIEEEISNHKKKLEDEDIFSDYEKVSKINQEIENKEEELNIKYLEWEEMNNKLSTLENV